MKSNLCVVGLAPEFIKNISKLLAYKLDMFYASVNEMLEFDLVNLSEAKELAGIEYVEKLENKKVKTLISFENAVVTMEIGTFIRASNAQEINKQAYIIFVDLPYELLQKAYKKEGVIPEDFQSQLVVYSERTRFCSQICDFHIKINNLNKQKIVSQILGDLATHKY